MFSADCSPSPSQSSDPPRPRPRVRRHVRPGAASTCTSTSGPTTADRGAGGPRPAAADRSLPRGRAVPARSAGEVPYEIDLDRPEAEPPRRGASSGDRLDRAVIALSSPIGIEALDRDTALELIDAHLAASTRSASGFRAGAAGRERPKPGDVDRLLARGCVGVSLPAGALAGAGALDALGPVLERIESTGAPLFVHPDPERDAGTGEAPAGGPAWWPALTTYVAQMQAAWLAFAALGRPRHRGSWWCSHARRRRAAAQRAPRHPRRRRRSTA